MPRGRGGQGNKGRKPGSTNKGYGPGSGRGGFGGFSGAGIGGSVGGQVGSALGGHLSKLSKQGKLGSKYAKQFQNDKGNLTFSGFKNLLSGFFGGEAYANAMGQVTGKSQLKQPSDWKIKQFLKHNIDIANPQPGLKINIDTDRAIKGIENEKVRNWLSRVVPKSVKDWKINHQMYYSPKIKPGDPRWTPQGTGKGPKLDKDTEKYFEWLARANPQGHTISDYNKLYKKQLDSGIDLFTAMKFNPAETGNFYALIDDTKKAEEKALDTQYKNDQAIYNNNNKDMSVTITSGSQNKSNSGPNTSDDEWLSKAYKETLGRDFSKSKGGGQYWLDQMKANPTTHSRDEVLRMLKASDEGKKYAASGKVQIGGIDPTKSISSQAGPGTWASHFAPGGVFENQNAAAAATQIAKDVGHTPSEAYFNTGVTDQTGADKTGTTIPPEVTAQTDGWWNQFADADAFKKFLNEGKEETPAKSDGMGDFMKFMMLMNIMRPGGGGFGGGFGGGSQYGYGGLNPGGVQAAYDPVASLKGMGTWFKDNFGSGGTTTSTVNTN